VEVTRRSRSILADGFEMEINICRKNSMNNYDGEKTLQE